MSKKFYILAFLITLGALLLMGLLFHYSDRIAMLNPKGLIAFQERDLMLIATVLMLIVVIPVFILTIAVAVEYRESNKEAKYLPDWDFNLIAECIWWGFPFAIVAILSFVTWKSTYELDPYKPLESSIKPINIQVIALRWKWLFIYPEEKIATVNYFMVPEQTPIQFDITADAPMNSFWIPELGGQIYAMPGMETKLHLIANEKGVFRGSSANLSGEGFAGMFFDAIATSPEEFSVWVENVRKKGALLDLNSYEHLAKPSAYSPRSDYVIADRSLFRQISMKPMMPEESTPSKTDLPAPLTGTTYP